MCRLFGLMANKEVHAEFSLLTFEKFSSSDFNGWGIGYYLNKHAKVIKEPIKALESQEFTQEAHNLKSNIIISHIRLATQGKDSIENTHPFVHGDWIFAHNGNIDIKEKIKNNLETKYRVLIKGETDSEVYFYWILQNIEKEKSEIEGIKKAVDFIDKNRNKDTTALNFLLSNGKKLFALKKVCISSLYFPLFYLQREPKKFTSFESGETKQEIHSKSLADEKAVIICTERLKKDEDWIPFNNNELLIVGSKLDVEKVGIN